MSTQIVVTAALVVVLLLILLLFIRRIFLGDNSLEERLNEYAALPDFRRRSGRRQSGTWVRNQRIRLNATLSIFFSDDIVVQLMSANWPITATEYYLTRFGITAVGFLLGWLISGSILGGLGLATMAYILPAIFLRYSTNKRRLKFANQLVDVLVLISGAVSAGFSLMQALDVVVREMAPPASEEFRRVLHEVSLGRSIGQALSNLTDRMQNKDLDLLVTAINIHYQVGGNLSVMLDSVTETIRERIRLLHEVRVLTTQQRYTAYILSLLPFIVAGAIFFINPGYMSGLFDERIRFIPILALLGIITGFILVRRLAHIKI